MVIEFSNFYDFPRNLNRVFEELWNPVNISQRRISYPPLNISEDESTIQVHAEVPGFDMKDIEITLTDGSLILKGKREAEAGNYLRQERPAGSFQRAVNLNVPVDRDNVNATLNNGILTIDLPKAEEAKPKKINIDVVS